MLRLYGAVAHIAVSLAMRSPRGSNGGVSTRHLALALDLH